MTLLLTELVLEKGQTERCFVRVITYLPPCLQHRQEHAFYEKIKACLGLF